MKYHSPHKLGYDAILEIYAPTSPLDVDIGVLTTTIALEMRLSYQQHLQTIGLQGKNDQDKKLLMGKTFDFFLALFLPLAQVYHGINRVTQLDQNSSNKTQAYHIKMNINLKRSSGQAVNPGEKFKSVISALKKADPNLPLLPLSTSSNDTTIHRIAHVLTRSPDLKNYLEYKLTNYQVECIFWI